MRSARSRASARRRWRRWSRSASAGGPFASLEDFAARIDPRLLNRRQLESLAGGGRVRRAQARPRRRCSPRPRRSSPMPRARTTSATSGQAGLFGGNSAEAAPIRLPRDATWTLAQRMAAERDAFGFYFSAHPVDAPRHLLAAHKVRTFAELADLPHRRGRARRRDHGRRWSRSVRWRTSAKGRRYMMATLSRPLGPVRGDGRSTTSRPRALEAAAKAGACGLLDGRARPARRATKTPRVTIKRFQPLDDLAKRTRLQMTVRVPDGRDCRAPRARAGRRARRQWPAALHRAARDGRRGGDRRGPRLRARRRTRRPDRAHHGRRQRRPLASRSRRSWPWSASSHPEAVAVDEARDPVVLLLVQRSA